MGMIMLYRRAFDAAMMEAQWLHLLSSAETQPDSSLVFEGVKLFEGLWSLGAGSSNSGKDVD